MNYFLAVSALLLTAACIPNILATGTKKSVVKKVIKGKADTSGKKVIKKPKPIDMSSGIAREDMQRKYDEIVLKLKNITNAVKDNGDQISLQIEEIQFQNSRIESQTEIIESQEWTMKEIISKLMRKDTTKKLYDLDQLKTLMEIVSIDHEQRKTLGEVTSSAKSWLCMALEQDGIPVIDIVGILNQDLEELQIDSANEGVERRSERSMEFEMVLPESEVPEVIKKRSSSLGRFFNPVGDMDPQDMLGSFGMPHLGTNSSFDSQGPNGLGPDGKGPDGRRSDSRGPDGKGPDGRGTDGRGSDGRRSDIRGADGQGADGRSPDGRGPDGRGPEGRGPDGRGPNGKGSDGRGPNGRRSDSRGPDSRGTDRRGPDGRGPDAKGPDSRGPDGRGPDGRDSDRRDLERKMNSLLMKRMFYTYLVNYCSKT